MPRLLLFRNSRFHFEASLERADGKDGMVECRVGEDRAEFSCTLDGQPWVAFVQHCVRGVFRDGTRNFHVQPWFVETGHHVGFILFNEQQEPLFAYDLDHQWQHRAFVRRGIDIGDQIAAETVAHILATMWRADEHTPGPYLCGDFIEHRRYPR